MKILIFSQYYYPEQVQINEIAPALVKRGEVIYFAHPVFTAYNDSGNYILEKYINQSLFDIRKQKQ